jgi:glycosyltransferase involved in cell wall biosynthesis
VPTPRVAVVVPCFNDGATLRETITSIDEPEPIELVVVDDGSTDPDTLAVLTELAAAGTRVVHQENPPHAWLGSPPPRRRTSPRSTPTISRRRER